MELYTSTSYNLAERLTKRYSTSFSLSSRLFDASIRPHIYAIYGLVRIADEIVDTYKSSDVAARLDELCSETVRATDARYSTNPIVHAFADTANKYGIDQSLLEPFFDSMKMDIEPKQFDEKRYAKYIYGSAEVVGLMCLRVFVDSDDTMYKPLAPGAQALGAAYQKVNFLRDMRADHDELGRVYFPNVTYESFGESDKQHIIKDIENDFLAAKPYIDKLPKNARAAVRASYYYYHELLKELKQTSAEHILARRIRVSNGRKLYLLAKAATVR